MSGASFVQDEEQARVCKYVEPDKNAYAFVEYGVLVQQESDREESRVIPTSGRPTPSHVTPGHVTARRPKTAPAQAQTTTPHDRSVIAGVCREARGGRGTR